MIAAKPSAALDLYLATSTVVGQEAARKQMAVLLDRQRLVAEGLLSRSSGAIVGGRSGVGKTMMARLACQACGLPFAETNATRYTEAGYAGLDLSQMFLPLIAAAARLKDEGDAEVRRSASAPLFQKEPKTEGEVLKREDLDEVVEIAQNGVILLDEFDKWLVRENHVTGRKDTAIQADLLKMLEGSQEYVSDDQDELGVLFDSTKVLILCAGAFVNLQRLVARRLDVDVSDVGLWDQITQEDFVKFGLLPELAGRLATHIFLKPLKLEDLTAILTAEGGIVAEYRNRFEAVGCEWSVPEEGVRTLAARALERETGARAIEHVCWGVFADALYQASVAEAAVRVTFSPMRPKAWLEAA